LTEEQWAELVAQHVKLQREYHAFFLTTQHTSATPAVQELAKRYAMPDGFWKNGIHSLLELLR
ncbi:hypothetical protein LZ30DRAFT_542133, partial [Colletotrichum cereale]